MARAVLASLRCRYSETPPSLSLTTQCARQLAPAHWIRRDSKSGAAAPILAMKQWEAGSVIRRLFNIRVEHITRASTARYLVAASLDVFI